MTKCFLKRDACIVQLPQTRNMDRLPQLTRLYSDRSMGWAKVTFSAGGKVQHKLQRRDKLAGVHIVQISV